MTDQEKIDKYLSRTGQNMKFILEGLHHFGHRELMDLIDQAEVESKKVIFYYATEEDEKADYLSYKLE